MKTKKIFKMLIGMCAISTSVIPLLSCSSCFSIKNINDDYSNEPLIPGVNNDQEKLRNLTFPNYFLTKKDSKKFKKIRNQLKKQITQTIDVYRLNEWNEYYQCSQNEHEKSKVFKISYADFKDSNSKKMKPLNNCFNKKITWTNLFIKQNEQFQYFNNFINIMNNGDEHLTAEEKKKWNYEDFLYLRSIFYSTFAADKYWNVKVTVAGVEKAIKDIGLADWTIAIAEMVINANPQDFKNIIFGFLDYYGFGYLKKINKFDFNNKNKGILNAKLNKNINTLIEKCIFHWELANFDLEMRLSSIPQSEIEKWPLWKQKINRFKKIKALQEEKKMLILNSFLPVPNLPLPPLPFPPGQNEEENQQMQQQINNITSKLKEFVNQLFEKLIEDKIADSIEIKKDDFYIKNNKK